MANALNKRTGRKRLSAAWKAYIVFIAVIALLCTVFLIYVARVVSEFDRAQPERCMDAEMERLKSCLERGGAGDYMPLAEAYSKYSGRTEEEFAVDYTSRLKSASRLEYRLVTGAGQGLEKVYRLTADDKVFATVRLTGSDDRTKLFFFSMADWSVASVTPMPIGGGREMTLLIPDGLRCLVNGVEVDEKPDSSVGGTPEYILHHLPNDVSVRFLKSDGSDVGYTSENGVIIPIVYKYSLTLPEDVSVAVDGEPVEGVSDDSGRREYTIQSMNEPKVVLTDMFGGSFEYDGSPDIPLMRYTVEIPDNFTLSAGGKSLSREGIPVDGDPDERELANYIPGIELHGIVTYRLSAFSQTVAVTVTDNLGSETEYELKPEFPLSVKGQRGADKVPDEILEEIDPMKFAVDWSKFMTNDESLEAISKYFLKGSKYHKEANNWAHGLDHTFTSAHNTPKFSDMSTSDFVSYGDNCFSVRVRLSKSMYLVKAHKTVVDKLDMIVYFVRYDLTPGSGADDPVWIVAVKHDA